MNIYMKAATETVAYNKKELSLTRELPDQILSTKDYEKC